MDLNKKEKTNDLLEKIGQALDLTESQYAIVEARYKAVATHLSKENSLLRDFEPDIMPQGSFLLGTMIKPIMQDDELDIDLVCRMKSKRPEWTQYHLKNEVGNQIRESETYKKMLDVEGKRCWTLIYAEDTKFHLDILPALVNENHFMLLEKRFSQLNEENIKELAIRITDNTLDNYLNDTNSENWLISNPYGYAGWFNDRKKTTEQRLRFLGESVKPLPGFHLKKVPLQRIVQILKRHRDIMFGGDQDKPISIIITTLAAKAYTGETDIVLALQNVLANFKSNIKYKYCPNYGKEIAWIENPVNEEENFADKWPKNSKKENNFYAWLDKAITDFQVLFKGDFNQIYRTLKSILGTSPVNEGFKGAQIDFKSESYMPVNFDRSLLSLPHRQQPNWPLKLTSTIEIYGHYNENRNRISITPNKAIPKDCDIYFTATTNVKRPFDVYWQVVNTGYEAESKFGLRGEIFHAKTFGKGGLRQKEKSEYSGTHWIEAFIVKDGICVARSSEFFVIIK